MIASWGLWAVTIVPGFKEFTRVTYLATREATNTQIPIKLLLAIEPAFDSF